MKTAVGRPDRDDLGPDPVGFRGPVVTRAQSLVLGEVARTAQFRPLAEIANAMGQHPNTVREHLDALVDAEVLERRPRPSAGPGRPAHEYRVRPADNAAHAVSGVRQYAGLASALADHIERTSADPSAAALEAGRAWGRTLAADHPAQHAPAGRRGATSARRQVVAIMDDLGFAPEADQEIRTVRLRSCPLLSTARTHSAVVCGVHLGLVRGALAALGSDAERSDLTPFAEVGACRLTFMNRRTTT